MNICEIYIVKEDNFSVYEINNTFGIGFKKATASKADRTKRESELAPGIIVLVNDIELNMGDDYIIEDDTLKFSNPLNTGDKITIKDSILNSVKVVTKNSYDKNSMYKLYSSKAKFRFNHNYKMIIGIGDTFHEMSFMTKYDPFYATVSKVRLDTGDLLENATDEQIARVIYSNSKETLEILGDDVETIPTYAKNYVRYKTNIDLCYSLYLSMTGKGGSYSKKIGDISIDGSTKLPYLSDMLSRFRELLKPNEDLLNSESAKVVSFVKGNSTEYPVSSRGVF